MRGVAFWFFALGVLSALTGMAWGIQMSASHDHGLAPAHAHLNLLGWVTCAIAGGYYHMVPRAAESWLSKVHFAVTALGLVLIVPGIVQAIQQTGETLAKAGSILTILAMLIFAVTVVRSREA